MSSLPFYSHITPLISYSVLAVLVILGTLNTIFYVMFLSDPNIDFKVSIFFSVKLLENGTLRYSYTYNRLI